MESFFLVPLNPGPASVLNAADQPAAPLVPPESEGIVIDCLTWEIVTPGQQGRAFAPPAPEKQALVPANEKDGESIDGTSYVQLGPVPRFFTVMVRTKAIASVPVCGATEAFLGAVRAAMRLEDAEHLVKHWGYLIRDRKDLTGFKRATGRIPLLSPRGVIVLMAVAAVKLSKTEAPSRTTVLEALHQEPVVHKLWTAHRTPGGDKVNFLINSDSYAPSFKFPGHLMLLRYFAATAKRLRADSMAHTQRALPLMHVLDVLECALDADGKESSVSGTKRKAAPGDDHDAVLAMPVKKKARKEVKATIADPVKTVTLNEKEAPKGEPNWDAISWHYSYESESSSDGDHSSDDSFGSGAGPDEAADASSSFDFDLDEAAIATHKEFRAEREAATDPKWGSKLFDIELDDKEDSADGSGYGANESSDWSD